MYDLVNWRDIAADFPDTLVLGNGASIALDPRFAYGSLFSTATRSGLIIDDVRSVFEYFSTTDFEHVLRMLWHALNVNRALSIDDKRTSAAYSDVRDALIKTVQMSHVEYTGIQHQLAPIQRWMGTFSKVFSLNYDLIVYWAMLHGNEIRGGNWFKDCWLNGVFEGDWAYLEEPYNVDGSTLVFFPHGSLLFATETDFSETKLAVLTSGQDLLSRILTAWVDEDAIPMFVSEGESRQKLAAIGRHGYLSSVYNDAMTDIGPSVAIYGWAMSENDDHILDRITARRVERIAVSVYKGSTSPDEVERTCTKLIWRIRDRNPRIAVSFYDASSPGCWNNP